MKCSSLKHSGSETKILYSTIQGPASALGCEVLGCCSRGGLSSLLPNFGLTTGPHSLAAAVTIFWHLYTQLKSTSKV
jgi:hypothetical protein